MTDTQYGAMPSLVWLSVTALSVDARYQRTIETRAGQANIKRIAGQFTWALFGAATVAPQGDGWVIIDGQHRVEAARRLGIGEVPCLIVEVDDLAEQARLFVAANRNRVSISALGIHAAMVAAGDALAVAVDTACRKAGVEILRYPVQRNYIKPGQTMAVGNICTVFRQHGPEILVAALRLTGSHWPERGGIRADRIRGLASAIQEIGAEATDRAIAALGTEALDLLAEAAADEGLTRPAAIRNGIIEQAGGAAAGSRTRPVDATPLLSMPVNRRCDKCQSMFKTRIVAQVRCDDCEPAGNPASPKPSRKGTTA